MTGADRTDEGRPDSDKSRPDSDEGAGRGREPAAGVVAEADPESADSGVGAGATDRPAAAVEDLTFAYGDVGVLSGLSLSVPAGATTAVVGPNGSGKTTLLRLLAGLLAPDTGRVATPDVPRPVGFLPQQPDYRPRSTVCETLEFYASLLEAPADHEAAVERVGLGAVRDRRVGALSGGMVRLLGLAQATLGDPPLLVLDEPTTDLDPRMTSYVFDVLGDLAADGAGVVVSTHDLTVAARADTLVLLDRGSVVAEGPPAAVVADAGADSLPDAFLSLVGAEEGLTVRAGRGAAVAGAEGTESDDAEDGGAGGDDAPDDTGSDDATTAAGGGSP